MVGRFFEWFLTEFRWTVDAQPIFNTLPSTFEGSVSMQRDRSAIGTEGPKRFVAILDIEFVFRSTALTGFDPSSPIPYGQHSISEQRKRSLKRLPDSR